MSNKGVLKVTKVIPALVARTQFGQIMERATKKQDRFLVSKKGEPQVIILSVEDYLKNILKEPKLLQRLLKKAKESGLNKMSLRDIDREIKAARAELKTPAL
ncbi:MAG: type II toxin-antitoxin system Phd/YefM family antitoxin [candidate division Zixibacteria bacterium]|nr:type II toxin-antitoxin system Phd/YefM family antitoxin [candidate division Zixibacteria bacterium]